MVGGKNIQSCYLVKWAYYIFSLNSVTSKVAKVFPIYFSSYTSIRKRVKLYCCIYYDHDDCHAMTDYDITKAVQNTLEGVK